MTNSEGVADLPALRALMVSDDERARYERRILAAEREGFAAGREAGWQEGYTQCDADRDAAWREIAHPVAQPEAYRREVAARALRAAEAGCRRDAEEHERAFVARAYATPGHARNEVQHGTVQIYPPAQRPLRLVANG